MKRNFTKIYFKLIIFYFILITRLFAQTSRLDISSSKQNVDTATTFNSWTVVTESSHMHHSLCYGDSYAAGPAPSGVSNVLPVKIGQKALVINSLPDWQPGTYLSCYPFNTIYTPAPLATTWTCCYMVIRRKFFITGNTDQQIFFSLLLPADNYVSNVIVDAATAPITISSALIPTSSLPQVGGANAILILSPGMHTIDIQCDNWESVQGGPGADYFIVNGAPKQWNPYGVAIDGLLIAHDNVLLNSNPPDNPNPRRIANTTLNIGPTPFTGYAKAMFSIADFKGNTTLQILDINNNLIKAFPIKNATGQIELNNIRTPAGQLIINIVSDGKILISKRTMKL